jgi:hypothetical protein
LTGLILMVLGQTGQVFGMSCVMLPCYTVVVCFKVVLAARLGLDPNSLSKLFELFFMHHIYVWCRAYVTIFENIGIFSDETYSLAIMFAVRATAPCSAAADC